MLKAVGIDIPGKIATASQLAVFRKHAPRMLAEARYALHIADWVDFLLCGVPRANFSMLSAGRLLDAQGEIDRALFTKLDIASDLFPPMAAEEKVTSPAMGTVQVSSSHTPLPSWYSNTS